MSNCAKVLVKGSTLYVYMHFHSLFEICIFFCRSEHLWITHWGAAVIEGFFFLNNHPHKTTYAKCHFWRLCAKQVARSAESTGLSVSAQRGRFASHQGCPGAVGDVSSREPKATGVTETGQLPGRPTGKRSPSRVPGAAVRDSGSPLLAVLVLCGSSVISHVYVHILFLKWNLN